MHDDPKPNRPLERLQFPGEDSVYRSARNALLDEEMALRRQIERVSAQRRALRPAGLCARTTSSRVSTAIGARRK